MKWLTYVCDTAHNVHVHVVKGICSMSVTW